MAPWHSKLSLHLQQWHPIWAWVRVSAAPLQIQIPDYGLQRQWMMTQVLGLLPPTWVLGFWLWPDIALAFAAICGVTWQIKALALLLHLVK